MRASKLAPAERKSKCHQQFVHLRDTRFAIAAMVNANFTDNLLLLRINEYIRVEL
jgi:hypothetical protein